MKYLLEVKNLVKLIDNFELGTINFNLEPGYIMGLIGPNGSGKTTLIQTILGLYQQKEGDIIIAGYNLVKEEKKAKDQIGFVLEDNIFLEELNAIDNARLYGKYYSNWNQNIFERYCKQFEINIKKPLKKLSKGTNTKFQLAFALSHDAKLLVFDEPSAGLDPVFRKELIEIMCDVISEGDKSIIFSTHLTDELDKIADFITFIYNGIQIFSLSKEEMQERYCIVKCSEQQLKLLNNVRIIGKKIHENYSEALILRNNIGAEIGLEIQRPTIEDIMYYTVNGVIS